MAYVHIKISLQLKVFIGTSVIQLHYLSNKNCTLMLDTNLLIYKNGFESVLALFLSHIVCTVRTQTLHNCCHYIKDIFKKNHTNLTKI